MARALQHAARQGHVHCLRLLLEEGADPNLVDEAGLAALHLACSGGHVACVRALVAHAADASLAAPDGRTAAEMARSPAVLAALAAAATCASASEGRLEGYLWKSSGREKNKAKHWQKRWFVLSDGVLSYYKTRKDVKPAGEIGLEGVTAMGRADTVAKRANSLQLVTAPRTFFLCADEEETIEQWRHAVEQARGAAAALRRSTAGEEGARSRGSSLVHSPGRAPAPEQEARQEEEGEAEARAPAPEALDCGDSPVRHMEQFGFLFKAGGKKGQAGHWQKRWVVLDSGCLSYYRKQSDTRPAGVILLATVLKVEGQDDVTKKENSFCVETPERTFYFYGTTESHREKWVEAINNNRRAVAEEEQAAFAAEEAALAAALSSPRTAEEEEAEAREGGGKEGFLWKTPGNRKKPGNWQRRWFVLADGSLDYYRAPKDAKAAGQVPLSSIRQVVADDEAKANGLNVHTPERTYFLYAPSARERDAWVAAIEGAMRQ